MSDFFNEVSVNYPVDKLVSTLSIVDIPVSSLSELYSNRVQDNL